MNNILKIFTDYKQFQILVLGLLSGMPLTIIYSTLSAWMKNSQIEIAVITTFAVARIFYSLKFLWAPLIDQINIPLLCRIGHRKSWMCLLSAIIAIIIMTYSQCDPSESLRDLYVLTIMLGIASASLDIVIDAFRIDIMPQNQQSIAAANAVLGYILGGLISGAGALFIAQEYNWEYAFLTMGVVYFIGIIFILTLKEQKTQKRFDALTLASWKALTIDPFIDFLKRDKALLILLAVILYKLGEAMFGVIATPFYLDLGFSYKEIAGTVKLYGLTALIAGSYIGGATMYYFGHFKGLIISGIAQSVTNLSFVWLHHMGHDINALMIAITIENIASGMGNAALVGYLSYLCNKKFAATQYALLSSASGLFSHTIVIFGGTIQHTIGWDMYFVMTVLLAIPGLLLLTYLNTTLPQPNKSN